MFKITEEDLNTYMTKFFSINDAIASDLTTKTGFIIANEREKTDGTIGRYYTVFPSFSFFLKERDKYPHCHELVVDHCNAYKKTWGRLVFDFDIKNKNIVKNIPLTFKDEIEGCVVDVSRKYFDDIDTDKFEFVWSTSVKPNAFSKHLTVKNLHFEHWMEMSRIFYLLFCEEWDKEHKWIESKELIDFQIIRKNASLRMVGSSKINGNILELDDPQYSLTDSLIRIYLKKDVEKEQSVSYDSIRREEVAPYVQLKDIEYLDACNNNTIEKKRKKTAPKIVNIESVEELKKYSDKKYWRAYKLYDSLDPDCFSPGKISGDYLYLLRVKPSRCIICVNFHEHENAFLFIQEDQTNDTYYVYFGCWRKKKTDCSGYEKKYLGSFRLKDTVKNVGSPTKIHDEQYSQKLHQFGKKEQTSNFLRTINSFTEKKNTLDPYIKGRIRINKILGDNEDPTCVDLDDAEKTPPKKKNKKTKMDDLCLDYITQLRLQKAHPKQQPTTEISKTKVNSNQKQYCIEL